MSGYDLDSTSSPDADSCPEGQISAETMERCALLLANGEMDWPQGFSDDQAVELRAAVRRCRRTRLVKFIAGRIAADIAHESRRKGKEA